MNKTPFSDLMIRIQSLRRTIDDANRALICGRRVSLIRFPEEVRALVGIAETLPKERRQQAIVALNALDADINAYTRILSLWQHQSVSEPLKAVG
jgi:hypothetical protein